MSLERFHSHRNTPCKKLAITAAALLMAAPVKDFTTWAANQIAHVLGTDHHNLEASPTPNIPTDKEK